jgi:MFS transporter, BCD family, chlorophyll transporter
MWKQEPRNPVLTDPTTPRISFSEGWRQFKAAGRSSRLLVAVGLGTAGFSMQDILLEPFGGQVFGLDVGSTTMLTALLAAGTLGGLAIASQFLGGGSDPHRIAASGVLIGILAFALVIFSVPLEQTALLRIGALIIGFGGGLFSVGMLTAAMELAVGSLSGLALGAWGAVQATAAGTAIALSGFIRDFINGLAASGSLGAAMSGPATGYSVVYHIEILLLFSALVALGPLVRFKSERRDHSFNRFGLAELPG